MPEGRNWLIKAVIINKSSPRTWKNSKGSGKVFNFEIVDSHLALKDDYEEREIIQVTAFNENATKYYKLMKLETPYFITKGIIKAAAFKNSKVKHPYCIHLDDQSIITDEAGEAIAAPKPGQKKPTLPDNNRSVANDQAQSSKKLDDEPKNQSVTAQVQHPQYCDQSQYNNGRPVGDWKTLPTTDLDESNIKYTSTRDLIMIDKGTRVDFVGIILTIGQPLSTKTRRGIPTLRINIQLGDQNLISVNLCLWGERLVKEVEQKLLRSSWSFQKANPAILIVRNARVSDYEFRSLNAQQEEAILTISPQTPTSHLLADWISQQQDEDLNFVNIASHKKQVLENEKKMQEEFLAENQKAAQDARFVLKKDRYRPIKEIINYLTVVVPIENFKQRVVLRTTEQLIGNETYKFHLQGILSGFKIDDQPFYKVCPGCGKRFSNQKNDCHKSIQSKPVYKSRGGPQQKNKNQNQPSYVPKKVQHYECYKCNKVFDYFSPQYSFYARFQDFAGELNICFQRQFGDALLGCPAQKFVDLQNQSARYGGKNEVSQSILTEMYKRLMYRELALEVCINYQAPFNDNKVQYVCSGVNWGKRIDWRSINCSLLARLREYREQEEVQRMVNVRWRGIEDQEMETGQGEWEDQPADVEMQE